MKLSNKFALIFLMALYLNSCSINIPRTITKESPLWGGYGSGKKYTLLHDAFIMVVKDGLEPQRLAVCPEGDFNKRGRFFSTPSTIEAYEQNPEKAVMIKLPGGGTYKVTVDYILRAGTTLQCSRVRQNRGLNWWSGSHNQITVYAKVLNGDQKGKEVDLQDVSISFKQKKTWLQKPDARLIKETN